MNEEEIGVELNRTYELSIEWPTFGRTIVKVAISGFAAAFGLTPGVGSGISSLAGAVDSIKEKDNAGAIGWQLFALAFAWALDQLRQEPETNVAELKKSLQVLLKQAKEKVDRGGCIMPASFLDRPTTLPIYRIMRDELVTGRQSFRRGTVDSPVSLAARFDAAFERAVYEVWSRRPVVFQIIAQTLGSPGLVATEGRLQWNSYRRSLIYDFEVRPIFGQAERKISLHQMYVPLRAFWVSDEAESGGGSDEADYAGDITHLFDLDSHLDLWAGVHDSDNIRLLGGGPGSGKSTALKALASRLARRVDVRPLFIALQHIDLAHDLREAINNHFTLRSDCPFRSPPLDRASVEDGPPLLLIFDGLDELARPGHGADDIANMFVTKLSSLTAALRGERGRQVRVVLSGRMASFQAVGRYLNIPTSARIEVHGFTPYDLREDDEDSEDLASIDQRPIWWTQYAALVGAPAETPQALTDARLWEVTREPLLCYLLVLSGFIREDWEAAAENTNKIFEKLVDDIWERGWGDGTSEQRRQGPGKSLSKKDFNRLMETVALAAWLGGDTRVCSKDGFIEALEVTKCEQCWENFSREGGEDIANLAMNFYLKGTEENLKGFEFTHKSFGDYLAARAITRIGLTLPRLYATRIEYAIQDWVRSTLTGELTRELHMFLRNQMRLICANKDGADTLIELKATLEEITSTVLEQGLPVQGGKETWRECEAWQRNSESMLWALNNAVFLALPNTLPIEERRLRVRWPENKSLELLICRFQAGGSPMYHAVSQCFGGIHARDQYLFAVHVGRADFTDADLNGSNFSACYLGGAHFTRAQLEDALFIRANLSDAKFEGANLAGATFNNSVLPGVDLFEKTRGKFLLNRIALLSFDLPILERLAKGTGLHRVAFSLRFNSEDEQRLSDAAPLVIEAIGPKLTHE